MVPAGTGWRCVDNRHSNCYRRVTNIHEDVTHSTDTDAVDFAREVIPRQKNSFEKTFPVFMAIVLRWNFAWTVRIVWISVKFPQLEISIRRCICTQQSIVRLSRNCVWLSIRVSSKLTRFSPRSAPMRDMIEGSQEVILKSDECEFQSCSQLHQTWN
jgi:hypothetical protein